MKKILLLIALVLVVGGVILKNNTSTIKPFENAAIEKIAPLNDCDIKIEKGTVVVKSEVAKRYSGFELSEKYDLTEYKAARFVVENRSDALINLYVTLSHEPTKYYRFYSARMMSVGQLYYLQPNERREIEISVPRPFDNPDVVAALHAYDDSTNMFNTPYSHAFDLTSYAGDLAHVEQIMFQARHRAASSDALIEWQVSDFQLVSGCRAKNPKVTQMSYDEFFPFIDQYGQYKHHEWENKVHSDEDLQQLLAKEDADLAEHTAPASFNKYGGWADGPRFEATGRFYFKKVDGKWWFVDPEGCLWWSHGVVRVTPSSAVTPLDNRRFYFENLPAAGDEFEQFYYTNDALLKPYYTQRGHKETYDFSSANIYRKYGENYRAKYGEMAHRRLRSWGLNTIANSSDKDICLMSQTPYIERLEVHSAPIYGTGGLWWQLSDPFDKSFKEELIAQLKEREKELKDPYLVGLFVDNELKWGNESFLAEKTAQNPATVTAKRELVKHYRAKYGKISKLNSVWGTSFASWNALLANDKALPKQASIDLVEFNDLIIHKYFRNIREVFNEYAPGVLYLGCRFSYSNDRVLAIGAQYCDAISHNFYMRTVADYKQPEGVDIPMIIGEFHFGTMEQGVLHHSLIRVANQKERGDAYIQYVRSALEHPQIVGTHWHQFSDQATTGRFDGENFQVGFTDVCDTPYYETIRGVREVGYNMYSIRYGKK